MQQTKRALDDCFLHDADRLTHAEALSLLRGRVGRVVETETINLIDSADRLLAETITAPRNVPAFDNAAVDGYAFKYFDSLHNKGRFPVAMRIPAGEVPTEPLPAGHAARIFTGAVMPEGADTVVMQEDCSVESIPSKDIVDIPPGLKPGANCRLAGEDLKQGQTMLAPGTILRPQEVGAIASVGKNRVEVYRPLRVALFSTGDEIIRPGQPLKDGQVYDSNHFLLRQLAVSCGAAISDFGILADSEQGVREALKSAAAVHDVILTSGGASRGEEDHVITTLDEIGKRHMWQLAIKPGRPMSFGQIGKCIFLGLPGNPVAAFVCFLNYARPVLMSMSGAPWPEPKSYPIPADFEVVDKKPGRREFVRGILGEDETGRTVVQRFARDGSGLITSLREADGLIEIAEDVTSIDRGQPVPFTPFSEYGLQPRTVI